MKEWPLLPGIEMTNDRNGFGMTAEVLNDGVAPSIDDVVKTGGTMGEVSYVTNGSWTDLGQATFTITTTGGSSNTYTYVQPSSINMNDIQRLYEQTVQAAPVPDSFFVNPITYQAMLDAGWDMRGDNEGLIEIERKAVEQARMAKLELDGELAMMELDPIQDRRA